MAYPDNITLSQAAASSPSIVRICRHSCRYLAIKLIRLYQLTLSPWLGNQCRFYPTCSHYAQQAIARHGLRRGGLLALRRLGKCHPFHPGGVDPVPGTGTGGAEEEAELSSVRNS